MVKEYYGFVKKYLKVAQIKTSTLCLMFFTAFFNKGLQLLIPLFAAWIIDYATNGDIHMTFTSLIFLILTYAGERATFFWNLQIYGRNMHHMVTTLESKIVNKVISVDENFTKKVSKGNLFSTINNDLYDIGDSLDSVVNMITTLIQIIILFFIITFYSVPIALLFLVYALAFTMFRNWADRKSAHYLTYEKKQGDKYTSLFSQIISGMQEIKTFNMFDDLMLKLKKTQKRYSYYFEKKRHYMTIRGNDSRLITYGFRIAIYIYTLYLMANGAGIELLVVVIGYHQSLESSIDYLINSSSYFRESMVSVDRVNNILDYREPQKIDYGDYKNDLIKGEVEFKNVSFAHRDRKILDNVSFKIKPRSLTMIVGQSGMGKSSILNLVLRLYKIDEGEILIDGINIYDYTKEVHSTNVSVVTQKPFVFNMSIRKNLDFVDTNILNQIEACRRVGIHDFISSLPQGYNTILRENGSNISGGQKQLIALARTLLSRSEILLFDEITSSLDPETGKHIMKLTKDLKKDHTIIMVTHKPEMMKHADRIIVLHNGKIVGDGKHNDLIMNNEYYRYLQARKSVSKFGVFDNEI